MNALHSCICLLILVMFTDESESNFKAAAKFNVSQYNLDTKQNIGSTLFQHSKSSGVILIPELGNESKSNQSNLLRRTPRRISQRFKSKHNGLISNLSKKKALKFDKSSEKTKGIVAQTPRIEEIAERSIHHGKRETPPLYDQYEDFNHKDDAEDDPQNMEEHTNDTHAKIKIKHHHHHHHHNHVREIVKKVREPYPVETVVHIPVEKIVEKIVHVPKVVEKIVKVPFEKIVHVAKPFAVEKIVEKKVPYTVEKVIHVPVERFVEKIVHVPKPYPVEKIVEKVVHIPIEKVVEKVVHIPKPYPVEKIVNKLIKIPRPYPVIKPVPYPVELKVPMHYERQHLSHHHELKKTENSNEESRKKSYTNDDNRQRDEINKENIDEQQFYNSKAFPYDLNFFEKTPSSTTNFMEIDDHLRSFSTQFNPESRNSPTLTSFSNYENRNHVQYGEMKEQASENNYHIFTIDNPTAFTVQMFEAPPRPFQSPSK